MELFINKPESITQDKSDVIDEFEKAKLASRESDRLKSAFLANMSHEVRTPINGIFGLAQVMLQSKELTADIRNDIQMIANNSNSLLSLVDDIMLLSKIETQQIKVRNEPLHLDSLMNQIHSESLSNPHYLMKNAEQQNIRLKYFKPYKPVTIMTDPDRLKQIIVNLIDNALKFTKKGLINFGYTLSLCRSSKNQYITFHVCDTGVGISKYQKEKIFEKFVQADDSFTRKYSGLGLGLAISKGLTGLLNGKIWCESTLGKGSTFYFTIPYHPTEMPENVATPRKTNGVICDWSMYTVLIVEDDVVNYRILDAMLRNTKVNVIHADSGVKAVEQARLNPKIDLVLMDIHLPEMCGLEATGKILDIYPTLPVIAQTANAMADDKDTCIQTGCADYISKPIDMGELLTKMSKFLPDK